MKKLTRGKINSFLAKHASDKRVLDIGAASGDHASMFPNAIALDIDPARKPDIVGDAHNLPFPDASFEVVVCSEVFEHLEDPRKAVSEMHRVLVSGGIIILTTRFLFPVHDAPGDYFRFTPYGLRLLFANWEIFDEECEADSFSTIAVLLQRIIFQSELRGGKITKGILWLFVLLFNKLDFLTIRRYGDIRRTSIVSSLLSSGIYIACRKNG
ncbi:MAG: methyltransferase domain-containing protein [Candidatus Pacebacteria bacterium]|nr:methyltransferase domain-containing protein [Candidatus Paceibacterota bacterium]MBP9832171.1 methyltransferase domain-containing protein [Candidatus Paceibacterota bacterium]